MSTIAASASAPAATVDSRNRGAADEGRRICARLPRAARPTLRTLQLSQGNRQTIRPEPDVQSPTAYVGAEVLCVRAPQLPCPDRYYTGVTSDWRARLEAHNAGRCPHTANGRPWQIDIVVEFADERRAVAFERYLKSGSGCAFAKRHLR